MSVVFQPDKYNVQVTHKATSTTGRWIIFLGQHYDGTSFCWDVGFFQTISGAVQRLHFKENKTGATIQYDESKAFLTRPFDEGRKEPEPKYHIFGPDGKG